MVTVSTTIDLSWLSRSSTYGISDIRSSRRPQPLWDTCERKSIVLQVCCINSSGAVVQGLSGLQMIPNASKRIVHNEQPWANAVALGCVVVHKKEPRLCWAFGCAWTVPNAFNILQCKLYKARTAMVVKPEILFLPLECQSMSFCRSRPTLRQPDK